MGWEQEGFAFRFAAIAAKVSPVFASGVRVGVAIGGWSPWVLVPPAIREACHHVVWVAAGASDDLTHFTAREPETLDTPGGLSQIGSMDRERLVLLNQFGSLGAPGFDAQC